MSFVALDSAKTLSPVPRLLKLTLALFYACSTLTNQAQRTYRFQFVNSANLSLSLLALDLLLVSRFRCSTALGDLRGEHSTHSALLTIYFV